MKSTKDIIQQMEKEFDEKFVVVCPTGKDKGREVLNPIFPEPVMSFFHSYTRTLLESFGEEVINNDEDLVPIEYVNDADHIKAIYINLLRLVRNNQRKMQRLKVKEIITNLK